MSDVKWIKITTDIFDDEKILLIEALPDAYAIITVWFKLLCLAGKINNSGVLLLNDKIAYTEQMLSTIFRMKESTVSVALQTFESLGMVETINGIITIPNWEKHQNIDGMEKVREQARIRMQKSREKQKLLSGSVEDVTQQLRNSYATGCATVTECYAVEKDIEEDIDIKKENIKERKFPMSILCEIEDEELRNLYLEFIKMRKEIKSPMTETALKLLVNKVNSLETDVGRQKMMLKESIEHSWKSVYPIKTDHKLKNNSKVSIDKDDLFVPFWEQNEEGDIE